MKVENGIGRISVATTLGLLMAATLVAAPVQRNNAFRAANAELPNFFPGTWQSVGELAMYNLSDEIVAYAFIFARPETKAVEATQERNPAAFVAKARKQLAKNGKTVTGNAAELYGENLFASIVISADDTEPPVLRCFLGLPPHVVKEADALALASKSGGAGVWRVRHCLMLGLFDEAFSLENATGTAALAVNMRTRKAMPYADAKARALAKPLIVPDAEQRSKCQEAWDRYRSAGKDVPAPTSTAPAGMAVKKTSVIAVGKDKPLQAVLQEKYSAQQEK